MATDPFSVLGVDKDAGDDEIKRRYLALVRDFPPDREPERFQTYRAAFKALHTERRRLAAKLLAPHRRRADAARRRPACRRRKRAGRPGIAGAGHGAADERGSSGR